MLIRPEAFDDRAAVRRVHEQAFANGARVAELTEALRDRHLPSEGASLVAVEGALVVAHVMLTRALLDAPLRLVQVLVLSPLGVRPSHQRRGIGGALVRAAVGQAAARGVPLVFLAGTPTYYARFGFQAGATLGFRKPSLRIPDQAFQVHLLPLYEPWMTGTLVYSPVFWDYDAVGLR